MNINIRPTSSNAQQLQRMGREIRGIEAYTVIGVQFDDSIDTVGVFAGHIDELSSEHPDTWVQHVYASNPDAALSIAEAAQLETIASQ